VSHFNHILNAYELMGFVDGTEPSLHNVIDEIGQATTVINSAYLFGRRKINASSAGSTPQCQTVSSLPSMDSKWLDKSRPHWLLDMPLNQKPESTI
jgi:hypothetical protein